MKSDTQQIALGLRQGDVVVLEALVEQYQDRLVRYLIYLLGRRDGVDDLVQETWLRVFEAHAIAENGVFSNSPERCHLDSPKTLTLQELLVRRETLGLEI